MDAETSSSPPRPRVRLYVFSLTVDWVRLGKELTASGRSRICVLTPHHLFPDERRRLAGMGVAECEFRTFHDLLDVADMEHCDEKADRLVVAAHGGRSGRDDLVGIYYATLTRLKNQLALKKLQAVFEVEGGAVLCGDLGIVPEVWQQSGLADCSPSVTRPRRSLWTKISGLFSSPMPFHFLNWRGERWLLAGRPARVVQYLDKGAVTLAPLSRPTVLWFNLQLIIWRSLPPGSRVRRAVWRMLNLPWRGANRQVAQLAATVHEHSSVLAGLAGALDLAYVNLQDSFLPGYYPSRYLLYRPQVCRYYVWDRFSQNIFNRHGLQSIHWEAYQSWALPPISREAGQPVRRIVYLASGAGDWTALKNRSDEDLALALLIEVAKRRPDISIYYRPHPLWLHPEHQGLNSIQRVIASLEAIALPNLMVSQGARKDGRNFTLSGNLSAVSSSVDEDIAWADLVLGEHSQTMLVAARRGKLIAGINVSRHPPYFGDYARIGFPLITSAEELLALLDRIGDPVAGADFSGAYNAAIVCHNRENCGEATAPMRT